MPVAPVELPPEGHRPIVSPCDTLSLQQIAESFLEISDKLSDKPRIASAPKTIQPA